MTTMSVDPFGPSFRGAADQVSAGPSNKLQFASGPAGPRRRACGSIASLDGEV